MRTPNLADRLSMANAAKKAQLERAKHMAEDPERAQRLKARDEIGAARNRRITQREAARRAAREQEAAELAARQAAETETRELSVRPRKKPRRDGWPSRRREKQRKPPSEKRCSRPAERAGKRRSAQGVKSRSEERLVPAPAPWPPVIGNAPTPLTRGVPN